MTKNIVLSSDLKLCACGCGQQCVKRFKRGHNIKREGNPIWKGGLTKTKEGYWLIRVPDYYSVRANGYVLLHIYIFEQYYQCCMLPWGHVHHIDGNKDNNDISNLMGVMASTHAILHNIGNKYGKKDMTGRICFYCFISEPYKWYYYFHVFVCVKCYNIFIRSSQSRNSHTTRKLT